MAVITEDGRIIDDSKREALELIDGSWVPACSPLYVGDLITAKILSEEELHAYIEKMKNARCSTEPPTLNCID